MLVVCLLAAGAASLAGASASAEPQRYAARAVAVADGATGDVLLARNADRRVPMASITKLMTALVTLERARPADVVTVDPQAPTVGEASIFLRAGERIRVRDLLAAALVQSANDAAYALAAHVGHGDVRAFVRLMNRKARELRLRNTRFARPDGLDAPNHYSTARDVLKLARVAMRRPLVRELVRKRSARIAGGRRLFTWNDLLTTFPGAIGVKTGHTEKAGWCEVAAARRHGVTIYAAVLGSPSRAERNRALAELLRWGLAQYARIPVVFAGRRYAAAAVPFSNRRIPLVAVGDAREVVRLGVPLVERVVAPAAVDLPVESGEELGHVEILAGRRVVARRPLVALEDLSRPSFRDRIEWYAGRTLDEAGAMVSDVLGAIG